MPIVIYFDALAEGEGGGCSAGGSFSIVSHGHTLHAVAAVSKVVSSCFVGSLKSQNNDEFIFYAIKLAVKIIGQPQTKCIHE